MRRREFIAMLGGAAALPFAAAQQRDRVRRLGIIIAVGKTPEYVAALTAFEQALESLCWNQGDNLRIEDRWSAGDDYAHYCCWATARARAKSGDAPMISGYVGKSEAFDEAIKRFARTYADQT